MRILALAILTVATVSAAAPARAQTYDPRYPVCLKVIVNFGGERYDCIYSSLEQCAQSAAGRPASASSTRITRAEQDATGGTAAAIDLGTRVTVNGERPVRTG